MNEGVQILLKRMDSNPDEFKDDGKWVSMFNNYKKYMTDEEKTAFMDKLSATRMEQFKQGVLKKLLDKGKISFRNKASLSGGTFFVIRDKYTENTSLNLTIQSIRRCLQEAGAI